MWPHPVAIIQSVFLLISIHVTKEKNTALCIQINLRFAEIKLFVFCSFNMLIMMSQEKDMVCRISQTYLSKEFFFFHLFYSYFSRISLNSLSNIFWENTPRF